MASSLLIYGARDVRWVWEPLRSPRQGEVILETVAGAVSVGTELPLYRGDAREAHVRNYPVMTGYESLARVKEVSPGVPLALGQRVVASYGHRTGACLPAANLIPVPDDIPNEIALLTILSNDASKGLGKLGLAAHDRVIIAGAGAIGLLVLHRLRWLGFEDVDVVEPLPERQGLALELGARAVYTPGELPQASFYSVGVECSSTQSGFALLQRHLEPNGRLCVLADGNVEPLMLEPEFHVRELNVVASSDGMDYPAHARAFFDYWRKTRVPLEKLFTWRVAAVDLPYTFERMQRERPVKVFVSYA